MSHVGYLIAGWSIGLGTLAVYGWSLVRRGKALASQVTPERRRWITTTESTDVS